jgi:antitoxin component YwqK of YwqJK toxin-antitoxin module
MKKKIYLLIFLLLVSACSKVKKQFYPDGKVLSEITYRGSKKEGPAKYYYQNGNVEITCIYKNDKLDGLFEKFYPDGRIQEKTNYKNGKKHGVSETFYENASAQIYAEFQNDTLHGKYVEYYANGKPKLEAFYNHGKYDGEWNFYDNYGNLTGKGYFSKGNGKMISYYVGTTTKRLEISYQNNQRHGEELHYDLKGKLIKKITYNQGKIVKSESYD